MHNHYLTQLCTLGNIKQFTRQYRDTYSLTNNAGKKTSQLEVIMLQVHQPMRLNAKQLRNVQRRRRCTKDRKAWR